MRRGAGKESAGTRGGTAWNDGLYSVDGGSGGDVPSFIATTEDLSSGLGDSTGGGADPVAEKTWFAPVETNDILNMECKDGVCPVPWAVKEEAPVIQPDEVNHPPHYTDGEIECIEAIEASLTPEEFRGYCKGNLMKYGWRERMKGGTKSLKKAQWYLDRLIQFDEAQNG
jgi:hypothetical protein